MSQISAVEAEDLLSKLLSERIPLRIFFLSASGARIVMPGFVDSKTARNGVVISVSGPPLDVARGYVNLRLSDRECDFQYGETREIPAEVLADLRPEHDSALMIRFLDFGETVILFFNL